MSSLLVEQFTPITFSGNEITDAVRVAAASWAKTQQGGQVDAAAVPGGFYIDRAATNLHPYGQCDSAPLQNWARAASSDTGSTITVDATVAAPFSPQSIKVVCMGVATQGIVARTNTGLALAAGTPVAGSVYFKGTAGGSYQALLRVDNTDATTTAVGTLNFTATGQWQLLVPPAGAVAAGKTGSAVRVDVDQRTTARAESIWAAHPMLEAGQPYVAPYVATSGGVTATNAVSSVQAPASLLSPIQGWTATLFRAGDPGADTVNSPGIFGWTDGTPQNGIYAYWNNGTLHSYRAAAGASTHADVAATWGVGDEPLVVNAWDTNNVYVSVNGAPFTAVANATIPAGLGAAFKIGDLQYASAPINSSVLWFGCGSSVPSRAQLAALNTRLRTGPLPRHLADTGIMF